MIFPANSCERLEVDTIKDKETILYFFGDEHKSKRSRNSKEEDFCVLKELIIEWDESTGSPKRAYIKP